MKPGDVKSSTYVNFNTEKEVSGDLNVCVLNVEFVWEEIKIKE